MRLTKEVVKKMIKYADEHPFIPEEIKFTSINGVMDLMVPYRRIVEYKGIEIAVCLTRTKLSASEVYQFSVGRMEALEKSIADEVAHIFLPTYLEVPSVLQSTWQYMHII